ncbi:ABC transporter ATP-binding protein [Ancylobacter dichloromethanicus]|uniref:ABC transporter ATP-binding protein n=1 Tax=Ancylobacter dichloromethanicus TaxID=518825 RepID=A0A9W6JAB4_9HYPH|nr:ABC transporter ATP-binding protein [Ancylobacter dichloromethanicus]MBS7554738.1 ABC transporter ATP-binding protein [Ancylobacter dichloromethanicus]GLK72344.1 ABC transporter ATP-binding protein [Ancylobacter dichloromethanicus]
MPLIAIDRLTKSYGSLQVLKGVSLDIEEGEFVALLGPSGCGKTTLLRAIAGFVDIDGGDIAIGGRSIAGEPPNRRPVNMVFQNYALFPHLTVRDNVAFGPRRNGVDKAGLAAIVDPALETVGMTAYADRLPAQLSGGQQQRVALARAIANKPKVLLLDEPLGALDLKLRKRMQMELKHLHQKLGITFLFVTHDQEEALVMADRIVVMQEGDIAQVGTGEDIYARPQSRYVADFIGEANLLPLEAGPDGTLRIAGEAEPLPYRAPAGAGAPTLLVRPEEIRVGAAPAGGVSLSGTLTDRVFIGNATRLFVKIANGQSVVIQQAGAGTEDTLPAGAPVRIGWAREAARVLTG